MCTLHNGVCTHNGVYNGVHNGVHNGAHNGVHNGVYASCYVRYTKRARSHTYIDRVPGFGPVFASVSVSNSRLGGWREPPRLVLL